MAPKPSGPGASGQDDLDTGPPPSDLAVVVFGGVLWKAGTRGVATVTRVVLVVTLGKAVDARRSPAKTRPALVARCPSAVKSAPIAEGCPRRHTVERSRSLIVGR